MLIHLDRQPLHLLEPAHLARRAPAAEGGLDARLHLRQIVRHGGAGEGLIDDALALAVRIAVEQRKAFPGEELLHVWRHGVVPLDFRAVDELSRRVGSGDDDGVPAEDAGTEDAAVLGEALVDERERILGEAQRLAEQRQAGASGRERAHLPASAVRAGAFFTNLSNQLMRSASTWSSVSRAA